MHIKTSNQPELKLGIGDYACNWGVHICSLYEKYYKKFPQCDCHVDMPEHFSVLNTKGLYNPDGVFSPLEKDKG